MEQFLESTTVHGFVYLNRRNSFCARIFWSCIILTGFSIAGYMIYNSLVDWDANQTITTLDSIATPIQEVQFPTVTVCPHEHSPPDNWSFLEKILNMINVSDSNSRNDITNPILTKLLDNLEDKYRSNPENPLWTSSSDDPFELNFNHNFLVEISKSVCNKNFSISDLRKAFVGGQNLNDVITNLLRLDLSGEEFMNLKYCDSNKCCDNMIKQPFLQGIVSAGYFLHSASSTIVNNQKLSLGSFLVNFANLTHEEIGIADVMTFWSLFNLDSKLDSRFMDKYCQKTSTRDKFLQNYFKDLGIVLGFEANHSLSLFDLPSILTSTFNYKEFSSDTSEQHVRDTFLYSQCEMETLKQELGTPHACYKAGWKTFLSKNSLHPCETNETMHSSHINCCHFWTGFLRNKLKPIMKVMRMASGRGNSHFNLTDFLQPFLENSELVKYSMNPIDEKDEIRDLTSFLPACIYSDTTFSIGENCKLFEPVVTDLGICYAFNAEPTMKMLQTSTFTEAFLEAYKYDLIGSPIRKAKGAGEDFALKFMVDNSRYLRKKLETKPFKIIVSSRSGYFNAKSVAKKVKPGVVTTFSVQPIEVFGTKALREVPEEARNCKFSDEINLKDSMFETYSQSSCEYKCRISKSREICQCTPWNFPTPPSITQPAICDLYGNYCFQLQMRNTEVIHTCSLKCPSNCDDVRFTINEKEIPIDVKEHCDNPNIADGYILTKNLLSKNYFPLAYNYYKMEQYATTNDSRLAETSLEVWRQECYEIMKNDIAIVNVKMESGKYIRTIKDKRMTFADKLAAFGRLFKSLEKFNLHRFEHFSLLLGGTLGLFTGMSILSMVEIVFWIAKIPGSFFKSK